jgi:hypothetical protein
MSRGNRTVEDRFSVAMNIPGPGSEKHDPAALCFTRQIFSVCDNLLYFLVMRLDKAFRVILNSPIFPKMTVERATDRSVRFGAQDESQLRIFIIKVSRFISYFY